MSVKTFLLLLSEIYLKVIIVPVHHWMASIWLPVKSPIRNSDFVARVACLVYHRFVNNQKFLRTLLQIMYQILTSRSNPIIIRQTSIFQYKLLTRSYFFDSPLAKKNWLLQLIPCRVGIIITWYCGFAMTQMHWRFLTNLLAYLCLRWIELFFRNVWLWNQ